MSLQMPIWMGGDFDGMLMVFSEFFGEREFSEKLMRRMGELWRNFRETVEGEKVEKRRENSQKRDSNII
jgi:hypothetical protein